MAPDALADAYRALIADLNRERAKAKTDAPATTTTPRKDATMSTATPPPVYQDPLRPDRDNARRQGIREHITATRTWLADQTIDANGHIIDTSTPLQPPTLMTFDELRSQTPPAISDDEVRRKLGLINVSRITAQLADVNRPPADDPDPA